MIFSSRSKDYFDNRVSEDISCVIRQCVDCRHPVSLRGVSKYDTHNIYYFESADIPSPTFLNMLRLYFECISIDVNKEHVLIKLTKEIIKDIPF